MAKSIIQVVGFLLPNPEKLQPLSICFLKLLFCLAAYPHFGHLKGFWSVWIMKWSLTFAARLNILEQTGHAHFPTSSLIGNICKTVIWSDEQHFVLLENPSTNKKYNHYESQDSFEDKSKVVKSIVILCLFFVSQFWESENSSNASLKSPFGWLHNHKMSTETAFSQYVQSCDVYSDFFAWKPLDTLGT